MGNEEKNPLRAFLDETGIGVRELARLTGIDGSALSRQANGKVGLSKIGSAFWRAALEQHGLGADVRAFISENFAQD